MSYRYCFRSAFAFSSLLFLLASCSIAFAQEQIVIPENKYKIEFNSGITLPYSDVQNTEPGMIVALGGSYFPYRFLGFGMVFQQGRLQEGYYNVSKLGMAYRDKFFSAGIGLEFHPFLLLKQKNTKIEKFLDLYAGIGIGGIYSNVRSEKVSEYLNAGTIPYYQGLNLIIPLELGYTFPIYTYYNIPVYTEVHRKRVMFQANFKYNLSTSDKLDGYMPITANNKKNDGFLQFTIGIAYLL